ALDAALAGTDHALHEGEVVLPPQVEVHVEIDERVAQLEEVEVIVISRVDVVKRDAALLEEREVRRLQLGRFAEDAVEAGALLARSLPEREADRVVVPH